VLLKELDRFPRAILVAGCQRSGTTVLARTITQSEGIEKYWIGRDDELDAALILSGCREKEYKGKRFCFQTTYLNECYEEYYAHSDYQLLWMVRNPHSVVYSMIKNWKRFALNELYESCGKSSLVGCPPERNRGLGRWWIPSIVKACASYNAKVEQIVDITRKVGSDKVALIEYEELVTKPELLLPKIYEFIGVGYHKSYMAKLSRRSINKSRELGAKPSSQISKLSMPYYQKAKNLMAEYGITL